MELSKSNQVSVDSFSVLCPDTLYVESTRLSQVLLKLLRSSAFFCFEAEKSEHEYKLKDFLLGIFIVYCFLQM